MLDYTALIVAAGAGTRMGLGYNKAYYRMADGKTILEHTMDCFLQDEDCKEIVVVTDSEDFYHALGPDTIGKIVVVQGGASREESVWNGMKAVLCDTVFVHDGARPFLPGVPQCTETGDGNGRCRLPDGSLQGYDQGGGGWAD